MASRRGRTRTREEETEETPPEEAVTPKEAPKEEEAPPAAEPSPEPAAQPILKEPPAQVSQVVRIPRKPKPKQPATIVVEVFAAIQRIRPDEAAGFLHYARLQKMGPRSLEEWRKAWDVYRRRPVK
jgi:hypothetical protein